MVERLKPPTVAAILGECQFEDLGADPEVSDSQRYPKLVGHLFSEVHENLQFFGQRLTREAKPSLKNRAFVGSTPPPPGGLLFGSAASNLRKSPLDYRGTEDLYNGIGGDNGRKRWISSAPSINSFQ